MRDRSLYLRVIQQARPYWIHLAGISVLSLLSIPLALLTPLPLKIAVDSALGRKPLAFPFNLVISNGPAGSITAVLTVCVGLLVTIALLTYLEGLASTLLQTYAGEKLVLEFRAKLFGHLQRLSLTYHDTKGTGDSVYRIQYDANCMQWILINTGVPLITSAIMLLGMIAVTAYIDWQLAAIAVLVCPVLYFVTESTGKRVRTRWRALKQMESASIGIVQEVLTAVRVVKAFGREDLEQERFVQHSEERVRGQVSLASTQGMFDLYVGLIMSVGTGGVLFFGIVHVTRGIITLGELLIVMAYLAQIYEPLRLVSKKLTELHSGMVSAERAFALLDQTPEVVEKKGALAIARARGAVEFRNIVFGYEAARPVLHEISFEVTPGARVGIQGRTGAGKSTLISLLMRFYDPDRGQILLDGVDLRDYVLADLRSQFALVLQEPMLFSTSLAENIGYGRVGASQAEIEEAARLANADEFIRQLPEGYDTQVGERGMKLSGGERQRISLARAFLKDAPVLILDEPTSSVDIKTEAVIMEAMERLMSGRTTFMIAHRLSTLEHCDLRLEIEFGHLRQLWVPPPVRTEASISRPAAF